MGLWAAPPFREGSGGCYYSWINSQASSTIVGKFFQQTNISLTLTVGWVNTATWGSMLTHISYTGTWGRSNECDEILGIRQTQVWTLSLLIFSWEQSQWTSVSISAKGEWEEYILPNGAESVRECHPDVAAHPPSWLRWRDEPQGCFLAMLCQDKAGAQPPYPEDGCNHSQRFYKLPHPCSEVVPLSVSLPVSLHRLSLLCLLWILSIRVSFHSCLPSIPLSQE